MQHGDAGLSRFQNNLHSGAQQFVAALAIIGRGCAAAAGLAALFALLHGLLDLLHDLVGVIGGAALLDEVHHPLDLLRCDEAALHTGGLVGTKGEVQHIALAHQLLRAGGVQNDAGFQ